MEADWAPFVASVARNPRDNRVRRSIQTTWWGCDLLSSTWSRGYLICQQTCVGMWMKPNRKEGGVIRRRVTASEGGGGDESRVIEREYRCLTHCARRRGLWMHSECNIEVSEVGRAARSLARGRHRRYTLTHKWRFGVPWESAAVLLQDQLLTGYWRGQAASSVQGRRSINAACRGVPPTKHAVHTC